MEKEQHAFKEAVNTVKGEARDSVGQIKSWFDSIRAGTGLLDRGVRRRRTRRGSPAAGRGGR